jgi:membrane protease YdiL (CAAX protease family)
LITLLLIRAVVEGQRALALPDWVLSAVPLLFIYAPVGLCHLRHVDSWGYRLSIPAFRDGRAWAGAAAWALGAAAVLAGPFGLGYHLWQTVLFDKHPAAGLPPDFLTLVAYQVFFVALPEEFFYRGYFQTRLNELWARRWLVGGVPFGPGALLANLYFAFGHSLVQVQWWHFATFFPGLVFAWMRERTGGVLAGALFHAICNIAVVSLDAWYGVR